MVTSRARRWLVVIAPVLVVVVVVFGAIELTRPHATPASVTSISATSTSTKAPATFVAGLHVPAGFSVTIFASHQSGARLITVTPQGVVLVAERSTGRIVALLDPDHRGNATRIVTVASNLNDPTSLDLDGKYLYVGEANRITRFTLNNDLTTSDRTVVIPNLPTNGEHTTRTILVGPDKRLYVAMGSSCNACVETDPHRAAIWVYNSDGSDGQLYSKGLRNAVGMAINPWTDAIWATNNGRDYLGDNEPPDTVNILADGANFGWPYCHSGTVIDPQLGNAQSCNGVSQPAIKLMAHVAPLGLAFYQSGPFPAAYHGLFVAEHGSWNRSVPDGDRIVFIPLNAQGASSGPVQDFLTGWLQSDGSYAARPVGLAVDPDGTLYVSDDETGTIYRVTYTG